jgi:hypothetical protein
MTAYPGRRILPLRRDRPTDPNESSIHVNWHPSSPFMIIYTCCGTVSPSALNLREVVGLSIEWQGWVDNVDDHGSSVSLTICSTNRGRVLCLCDACFPPSQRSRLYGLRKVDVVRVTGSIKEVLPEAVYVFGTNFSLGLP